MKRGVLLGIVGIAVAACKKPPPPPPEDKPPPPPPSASVVSAPPEPPQAKVPTFVVEPFEPLKTLTATVHVIDGAVIVTEGLRVGRIDGERVAWFGEIPDDNKDIGGNEIRFVWGSWPDGVDVYYSGKRGYGWRPTIVPLTGKGSRLMFGDEDQGGWFQGVARLGPTVIVASGNSTGRRRSVIRGPTRTFEPIRAEQGGCKPEEVPVSRLEPVRLALPYWEIGATGAGTFMTVGNLCNRENALAVEVWDQQGTSRIVELSGMVKHKAGFPTPVPGKGDELWLSTSPVIHYKAGTFEALPPIGPRLQRLFVSPSGKLHALAGRGIFRFDEGRWTRIANLPYPMKFRSMGMDDAGTIWVRYAWPARLRESKGEPAEDECTTPFVYVGEMPLPEGASYTFRTTLDALTTFPALSEISGIEYIEGGGQHFGVQVKSWAQADAVIAHIRANVPDASPERLCFAPKVPNVVEIKRE
ncbi:hypothetical protein [Polyangium sp. y55x31]|uniref:hypothetical protein n=1 Tax=Polyangium sp. y55x31 TaxID=3042688 RepID=UPI002482A61D|nr:hypothetical protein [Polyangium sp. y55x31]MDI1477064.1 hypothetical protein [Polyangium sp. y55x31]